MYDLLTNTIAFVFALGVIIFVHEAGHLAMAKAFGIRVLAFSLGFGKRIWGFEHQGTEYKVSIVPLGGYVQLGGENVEDELTGAPDEFLSRPRWQRALVYLAGPAMNFVLSIVLIGVVFMAGTDVAVLGEVPSVVGTVEADSPAAAAGLESGDRIVQVDGKKVERWGEVLFALSTAPDQPVELAVERGSETLILTVVPEKVPKYEFGSAGVYPELLPHVSQVVEGSPAEEAGFVAGDEIRAVDGRSIADAAEFVGYVQPRADESIRVTVLRQGSPIDLDVVPRAEEGKDALIGVGLSYTVSYPPGQAFIESVRYNYQITEQIVAVLGRIFTGRLAAKSALSGPIEIAAQSGAAARRGFGDLLFLMGLISTSIAVLNLFPIPVLDGGQLFLLMIEGIIRRDLSVRIKERINQVGFVLIMMLMVTVLYFDLVKNIPSGLLPGS